MLRAHTVHSLPTWSQVEGSSNWFTSRNMFFCLMIAGFKLKFHLRTPDCQLLGMLFERGRLGAIWPRSPRFAKVFRPSGTDACRKHIPSFVVCLVGKKSSAWFMSFGYFFLIFVCYPCRCTWSDPFLPKRVPRPKATKIDQFPLLNSCWRKFHANFHSTFHLWNLKGHPLPRADCFDVFGLLLNGEATGRKKF